MECKNPINEMEFTNLELQIEALIYSRIQLEQENLSLRKQLAKMTQKHAQLSNKIDNVTQKIKRTIVQLRKDVA